MMHGLKLAPCCFSDQRQELCIVNWKELIMQCFWSCREKLEDLSKRKAHRWLGFNRFVKEFHKRKERTHREKADKLLRDKINALKNNDVEGYLRMVQVGSLILLKVL